MKSNYAKKLVAGTLVASMTITASMPLFADELATEIPSAGAAVIVEDYIINSPNLKLSLCSILIEIVF